MNKYPQEMYPVVCEILLNDKSTRDSDLRLYVAVLDKFHMTTDLRELQYILKGDMLNTIKRCRQKAQENNPFLKAKKETEIKREEYKEIMLDFARRY